MNPDQTAPINKLRNKQISQSTNLSHIRTVLPSLNHGGGGGGGGGEVIIQKS